MRTVLVTGGGGYIGSNLVPLLLHSGHKVRVFDRFFFGRSALEGLSNNDNLEVITGDIRSISPNLFQGIHAVVDLAALSNDPTGDLDVDITQQINVLGRRRVAQLAKEQGVEQFILASSCSVYGDSGNAIANEDSPTNPLTTYARSMLKAEEHASSLASDSFKVWILRNATVFGVSPRMRFDLVVNLMTLSAVERGKILIMGGGQQWRPLVHVLDVCDVIREIIATDPLSGSVSTLNIGLGNYQVRSLAYEVRENLPFPVEIEAIPDDADKRNYRVSFDRLHQTLSTTPQRTVSDAVPEIYSGLKTGVLGNTQKTSTINWYKYLLEAESVLAEVTIDGRVF